VSHPSALLKVVTQEDLNDCFNAPSAAQPILEMRYRMDDPTVVPVRGSRVPSQKLLLKITRRRKREANVDRATAGSVNKGKEKERDEGLFMAEIVGPLTHTVRFRGE
jgi:general transcription factor 3C polypeptide 5 (transcription factor C subunit 1)